MSPPTPSFPSENLTPILPPSHIIQLYLSVRALHYPSLIETQPMFWGWKGTMRIRQIRDQT